MIDLRHEPCLGAHERVFEGGSDLPSSGYLRQHAELSENAARIAAELDGREFGDLIRLSNTIDAGRATGKGDEAEAVYDAFPILVRRVIDLFNMVSRRDEAIAELEAAVYEDGDILPEPDGHG